MRNRAGWVLSARRAVLVALACVGPAVADFRSPVAITNVTVISPDGAAKESVTILMDEGRIVAVGRDVAIPAYADVVDGEGLVAYAGFMVSDGNLGIADETRSEEERQRWEDENPDASQRALVRTRWANRRGVHPEYRAVEHFEASDKTLKKARAAGLTAVVAGPTSGIFGGTGALVSLGDRPLRRSVLVADVGQYASFDVEEEGSYPRSLLGVFAVFRQSLLDAAYWRGWGKFHERHPRSSERRPLDEAMAELGRVLEGRRRLVFRADSVHEINRALNLAGEFNVRVTLSGAKEAYKAIDRIKREQARLIVGLDFKEEPEYGKQEKKKGGKGRSGKSKGAKKGKKDKKVYEPVKALRERRRIWDEHAANLARLEEAGIGFALSLRGLDKPAELVGNLRRAIEMGLSADAALAGLTTRAAEMLGIEDRYGRIEPGYVANVVLWSGRFEEKDAKVRYVFVDGRKFDLTGEHKKADGDEKGKNGGGKGKGEKKESATGQRESKEAAPKEEVEAKRTEGVGGEAGGNAKGWVPEDAPVFACEVEADRIPKMRTGGDVLIRGGTVLPVSGPAIEGGSVLIQGGKITGVGRNLAVPAGVTVIDATRRYVMPGIIDPHSHMALSGVNEGTMSVTAEVRVGDLVYNDSPAIYRALAGGATTTHAMHGSANPIGGQNVVFKLKYLRPVEEMIVREAPRTIKFALGENVKRSNFFRPGMDRRFPATRMGVEAVIRDALTAGQDYARQWDAYRAKLAAGEDVLAPRRDLRLEALADVLRGDLWIHSHCYRSDEILRLMHVAEDFGIRIAVLQHVLEGYRIAPEIARHGCGASTFSDFWAYKVEAYGAIPYNAALMTRQGINVTLNSDSPNTIRRMYLEAAKAIRWGGLTENEALRLVTLNGAIQLGLADRIGSIEPGKDGDIAIFSGHPLNTHSKCVMTLIEGEVYFEDDEPDIGGGGAGVLDWNKAAEMTRPESVHRLYAIVGGTVHPVSGPAIEGGTVLIRNDRIEAVGRDVVVPPGAGVVDARGLHVYPGLIDAGGRMGLTEIGAVRATRDTADSSDFGPELRAIHAVHPHSAHVRIARTAGITSQMVLPSGGMISGQSSVIELDGWTADEMVVSPGVGLVMSVPVLPERMRGDENQKKRRREQYEKNKKALEEFMARAKRYAKAMEAEDGGNVLAERDLRLAAMAPYVRGEKPVMFRASGYQAIVESLDFAEEHGLKAIIYGGADAWKCAETLKEKDVSVILSTVFSYPRWEFEEWDAIYRCAARLEAAGVPWCFASGSASSAYDLGMMAGTAVAHGLAVDRAVYGMTLGAARVLGLDDRLGSLEPGKVADVMVSTQEVTQAAGQVTHVFIRGRPVDLSSMHTKSYERFKNRPEPALPPVKPLKGSPSLTVR